MSREESISPPQIREYLGPERRVTVVLDRAGWSPESFKRWHTKGVDVLTYRADLTRAQAALGEAIARNEEDGSLEPLRKPIAELEAAISPRRPSARICPRRFPSAS